MRRVKTSAAQLVPHISPSASFRLFLQAELARRCSANAQYSLRSFALQLEINHSTLSQLLRGKRPVTCRTIERLGARLGLAESEIEKFVARERLTANDSSGVSRQIRQLTVDTVNLLSDGTHRAILELTRLADFQPDSRWIARVLNLTVDEVNIAISRLARLGLLEMADHTVWVDRSGMTDLGQNSFANLIVQRLSEQVRQLSIQAGQSEKSASADSSESNFTRFVISSAQMPAILTLIEKLGDEAEENHSGEDYQVEINIFPIQSTYQPEE